MIYVELLKALYGMLNSSLLWYKKFRGDLEEYRFKLNNYDPCIVNKMVNGKLLTIRFHIDDIMSSHMDSKVNDMFLVWLNEMYGQHREVKGKCGLVHDYLGMTFHFDNGEVKIDMVDYVKDMLEEFLVKFSSKDTRIGTPAGVDLFKEDTSKKLNKKREGTIPQNSS